MRLDIVAFGYATAAAALEDANHHAAIAYDSLTGKLRGYAAMAGDASIAADFAAAYDDAATVSVGALGDLVTAFANLGRLTQVTVANHRNANRRSVIAGASVYDGSSLDAGYVSVLPAAVPSSLGGDPSSLPDWANWILDRVEGFVWPDADIDRLRMAAATWREAARQVDHLTTYCGSATDSLWRERSPEIPVAVAATEDLVDTIRDLAIQCTEIAVACETYADQVEEQREAILDLVSDLLRDAVIIQGIGIVLGAVTAGATAAGAAALNAGKIALAAPRLLRILALLRTLASAAAATIRSATTVVRFLRLRLARFRNVRLAGRSGEAGSLSLWWGQRGPGWHRAHEVKGSHTLARHVGKSADDLTGRLDAHPNLSFASSFDDVASAERIVGRALDNNAGAIRDWLAGALPKLRIDDVTNGVTGVSVSQAGALSVSGVRVVLVRDAASPDGYRILTSFPQP